MKPDRGFLYDNRALYISSVQLKSHLNLPWQFKYNPKVMSAHKKTSRFHERLNFSKWCQRADEVRQHRRWRALLVRSAAEDERANLLLAIEEVKKVRGVLLVAKLDRLSRRCSLLFMLRESGIDIRVAERPSMSKLEFGILAILAEQERDFISTRTKQGLEQVKKRGVKLGNPQWQDSIGKAINANREKAESHRAKIIGEVEVLRRHGLKTLKELANGLNYRGITTRTGGKWYPMTVKRVMDSIAA